LSASSLPSCTKRRAGFVYWSGCLLIWLLLSATLVAQQGAKSKVGAPSAEAESARAAARGEIPALVVVTSDVTTLELKPDLALRDAPLEPALLAASGTLNLQVLSALPRWSLQVQVVSIQGPGGNLLPTDRLRAATARAAIQDRSRVVAMRDSHRSLAQRDRIRPTLASATKGLLAEISSPAKARSITNDALRFEVRPRWTDPPGLYVALVRVQPIAPPGLIMPTVGIRSGPTANSPSFKPLDAKVRFTIQPFVWLSMPRTDLYFVADPLKGSVDTVVEFSITTNARSWFVDCQASELVGDVGSIPAAERIRWERLDRQGRVLESGRLHRQPTVAIGTAPGVNIPIRLRFVLEVGMDDHAGTYHGRITLAMSTKE
jgi:hypothetical protein